MIIRPSYKKKNEPVKKEEKPVTKVVKEPFKVIKKFEVEEQIPVAEKAKKILEEIEEEVLNENE